MIFHSGLIRNEMNSDDFEPTEEELKAFEEIKTGKVKMIRQTGEEFLKELDELIEEETKK